METDIEDNLSTPNSWLPLKAIKKLMGIKEQEKNIKITIEPRNSPCIHEEIPNKNTNSSSSLMRMHSKYRNQPKPKKKLIKNSSYDELRVKEREEYIKTLEQKLKASESETLLLKNQLRTTEKEITDLNKLITNLRTESMIKIQNIQEKHEKKLHKTKKDLDFLLKEMNNRSNLIILDDFIRIHLSEMEKYRQSYEEILKKFLKQLKKSENQGDTNNKEFISTMTKNIEEKLDCELENLKERYEIQIEKLKELVTNDSLEAYYEDDISTGLNSERATSEFKGSILENVQKFQLKKQKN